MEKSVLFIEGNRADSPHFVPSIRKKEYRVEIVRSGREALRRAVEFKPDLIILNAASMGTNGSRICSSLRSHLENTPIIAIHAENENYAGEMDADVVLNLPFTPRKLINRIKALVPAEIEKNLKAGPISLDEERHILLCGDRQEQLTPKLAELMAMFLENPGTVLERKDLFAAVWQTEYLGDTRTLDVHISWLRQAIEKDPRHPEFIKTIRGVGYRLDID